MLFTKPPRSDLLFSVLWTRATDLQVNGKKSLFEVSRVAHAHSTSEPWNMRTKSTCEVQTAAVASRWQHLVWTFPLHLTVDANFLLIILPIALVAFSRPSLWTYRASNKTHQLESEPRAMSY